MRRTAAPALLAAVVLLGACSDKEQSSLSPEQEAQLAPFISQQTPVGMVEANVSFDDKIHLVGYVVSPRQAVYNPGATVHVMLVWRIDKEIEPGWELFTHLVSEDGHELGNIDGNSPLRRMKGYDGQPLPPSRWKPGRFYIDNLTFIVPGDPSPTLVVGAGIVHAQKGRLPIRGPGGDAENRTSVVRLRTGMKSAKSSIKTLDVPKLPAGVAIGIDGRLDEPAWASAPVAGPFVDVGSGRPSRSAAVQGSARLLWDDAHLYVGFEVQDRRITGGFAPDTRDPHLWERDTVEIMIDPDGDGDNKDYYEIQINPQNLVFDSQFDDYNAPRGGPDGPFGHEEWSANLTSAVTLKGTIDNNADQDEGYTVEAKIPWSSLGKAQRTPPAPGDAWRMNFYAMQNNGGTGWSPIYGEGNFHRARRFGRIRFQPPPGEGGAAPATSSSASAGVPRAPPPSPAAPGSASASAGAPRPAPTAPSAPTTAPETGSPALAPSPGGVWRGDPDR